MKRNENCFGYHELPIKIMHKGLFKTNKIYLACNIAKPFSLNNCSDYDNFTLRFGHYCPRIGV
jgi:hypothetical protein